MDEINEIEPLCRKLRHLDVVNYWDKGRAWNEPNKLTQFREKDLHPIS